MSDSVLQKAIDVLRCQQQKGVERYGQTIEQSGLTRTEILDHAIEEAADLLIYLTAIRALEPGE